MEAITGSVSNLDFPTPEEKMIKALEVRVKSLEDHLNKIGDFSPDQVRLRALEEDYKNLVQHYNCVVHLLALKHVPVDCTSSVLKHFRTTIGKEELT